MKDKYLFDASVIFPLLKYIDKIDLENSYILKLTLYEIGHAIWKESYIYKRVNEPAELLKLLQSVLKKFNIINDLPLSDIVEIGIKYGLTYYASSYVFASIHYNLKLVTNDKEILGKYKESLSLEQFLKVLSM